MEIEISGGSKKQRRMVNSLSEWLAYRLMRLSTVHQLYVEISLDSNLLSLESIHGDCVYSDDQYRPREFEIRLDSKQSTNDLLTTLCHEFVHLRQYATGQLIELSRKPLFKFKKNYYPKGLHYDDQPWEVEAHDLERKLFDEWLSDK